MMEVGGGESGYIAVRPDDPNIIYAGSYSGLPDPLRPLAPASSATSPSGRSRSCGSPRAATSSIASSGRIRSCSRPTIACALYATGNHVFRSTRRRRELGGHQPDLTRNDPSTLGRIRRTDHWRQRRHRVLRDHLRFRRVAAAARACFWAGSDDGLIHISRDGGATWQTVTPTETCPSGR